MQLEELIPQIVAFRDARDWKQFHTGDEKTAVGFDCSWRELVLTLLF